MGLEFKHFVYALLVLFVILLVAYNFGYIGKDVKKMPPRRKVLADRRLTQSSEDKPSDEFRYVAIDPNFQKSSYGSGVINRYGRRRMKEVASGVDRYSSWNDIAQYQSLEPEVYASHQQWVQDANQSTTGASIQTLRDDPNDVNPQWGLFRRTYQANGGAQSDARVDNSEYVDQMPSDGLWWAAGM